ncbi:DUF5753 domain-containing protein [Streptomyces roseirectus]|uniref:DUF5753 domain-containing protein n=1 Tax=Streptomyces roseirectus TaxID=2768066 RepID=UPI001FE3C2DB|nr:DUF5753 domain-containing protein [Streptomyces roseirectus]
MGQRLGYDSTMLNKIENGHVLGGPEVAEALDALYKTPGLLLALWELANADVSQFRQQYRRYMKLEGEALCLWHFGVSILPGLLQTPEYAREILAVGGLKGDELDQQVEARTSRRKVLEGDDAPPFRAVLSEASLRTPLSDPAAWRRQLESLLEACDQPGVTIQVLPHSAGLHGLVNTNVMFMRLANGTTVAWTENATRGELIEDNARVEELQRKYDAMRDLALSPAESRKFIMRLLEELPCEPST